MKNYTSAIPNLKKKEKEKKWLAEASYSDFVTQTKNFFLALLVLAYQLIV